jgi:hypothetical protein
VVWRKRSRSCLIPSSAVFSAADCSTIGWSAAYKDSEENTFVITQNDPKAH